MDISLILVYSGLVAVTAIAIGLAYVARQQGLGLSAMVFSLLLVPWYLEAPWPICLLDYPSWWDQYLLNSTQWYPAFVAASLGAGTWGRRRNGSKSFLRTVALIPLLSWFPWSFVFMAVAIVCSLQASVAS